jgi:hypothetical protein
LRQLRPEQHCNDTLQVLPLVPQVEVAHRLLEQTSPVQHCPFEVQVPPLEVHVEVEQ